VIEIRRAEGGSRAWAFTVKRGKITQWKAFENTEAIAACYD
jgi:hypothetical protein